MSDILIGVIVFGLVFGAAIFGMFLGRNLRVIEQKGTLVMQPCELFSLSAVAGSLRSTSCSKIRTTSFKPARRAAQWAGRMPE